jgi:4'-phosphopantetheinyl transferase
VETHVWLVTVAEQVAARHLEILASAERAALLRFRRVADATRFATAHAALRYLLARRLAATPEAIVIDRTCRHCGGDHGKPRVPGLDFSMSKSGGLVAIAMTTGGDVGIDIELDTHHVADRALTEAERRVVTSDRERVQLWCCKEAVVKATGHGLAIDPQHVVIERVGARFVMGSAPPEHSELLAFALHALELPAGHAGAIALRPDGELVTTTVVLDELAD